MSLYPNPRALYDFWAFEETESEMTPDALLEIPQIQVSFEDRDELENTDRKVIKEDRSLLTPGDESYLVRVPHQKSGAHVWEDTLMEVPPPLPVSIQVEMDPGALESLESLPQSSHKFEMDLFMFPAPIQGEKGDRPVVPYMLLTVDAGTGMVVGTDLLEPLPSLEVMWSSVPLAATRQLTGLGLKPEQLTVDSELLFGLLQPLAEASRFELKQSPFLPTLHEAVVLAQ